MLTRNEFTKVKLHALTATFSMIFMSAFMVYGSSQAQDKSPSLNLKLARHANFMPQSKQPLEQLIEVAKYYKISMGIEWDTSANCTTCELSLGKDATVKELIDAILLKSPSHQMIVEGEFLHVSPPRLASDPKNLLNLKISRFNVVEENLLRAEAHLRLCIDFAQHPEEFANGYISSSGFAPDDVFAAKEITVRMNDSTLREILDALAKANGNALWVVEINEKDLGFDEPSKRANESSPPYPEPLPWKFIPLEDHPSAG
jgi:hypothetical protein